MVEIQSAAVIVCYPRPIPEFDNRRAGDGGARPSYH